MTTPLGSSSGWNKGDAGDVMCISRSINQWILVWSPLFLKKRPLLPLMPMDGRLKSRHKPWYIFDTGFIQVTIGSRKTSHL